MYKFKNIKELLIELDKCIDVPRVVQARDNWFNEKWLSMDWTPTVDYEGALEALTHEGIVSYLTKEVNKMWHALCYDVLKGATPKTIDSKTSKKIIKYHQRWSRFYSTCTFHSS